MNLKDIELLKGAPADILAEIKPKNKPYTVSEKVLLRNETARNSKVIKSKQIPKQMEDSAKNQKDELTKLLKRIEELETGNKKIKPLVINEPVEINKPLPMVEPEEPLPPSMEEQYKAKEDIMKKEIPNMQAIPTLPINIPYKPKPRVNSILPFNWKDAVQREELHQNNLNISKYLKGRKY